MNKYNSLSLQQFYPDNITIKDHKITEDTINLTLKSVTRESLCHKCKCTSKNYHSTYIRKINDLSILGKYVSLEVTAYRYYCINDKCNIKVFAEELEGFTGRYRRKTERLEQLIITIASHTSCEGAARICKQMGINISGDSIIRLLKKNHVDYTVAPSEVIGVDDWAYKKGHTYGTIICDGITRKPITLLDGRDGSTLKEWLQNNTHIKIVTRDRASAYAKAISEVLPTAVQIADRFHLYQNLFKAVKEAISSVMPNQIPVPNDLSANIEVVSPTETKKNELSDAEIWRKDEIIKV